MKRSSVSSSANSGKNELEKILSAATLGKPKKRHIPPRAMLSLPSPTVSADDGETRRKGLIELPSCCDAGRFWAAGFTVEAISSELTLPCDKAQAEKCKALWDMMERVELYESQSAAAKHGAATMLRHLGEVRLGQNAAPVEDPGIGDIIFGDTGEEQEN